MSCYRCTSGHPHLHCLPVRRASSQCPVSQWGLQMTAIYLQPTLVSPASTSLSTPPNCYCAPSSSLPLRPSLLASYNPLWQSTMSNTTATLSFTFSTFELIQWLKQLIWWYFCSQGRNIVLCWYNLLLVFSCNYLWNQVQASYTSKTYLGINL